MTPARVDVVVAGSGDAARRAAAAAERAGARVALLPAGAIVALVRPADAVHGVCHRTEDGREAVLEADAVVLAPSDPAEAGELEAAARAAGAVNGADDRLDTDTTARVRDASGLSIPGLYAAADGGDAEQAGARAAARAATRAP